MIGKLLCNWVSIEAKRGQEGGADGRWVGKSNAIFSTVFFLWLPLSSTLVEDLCL